MDYEREPEVADPGATEQPMNGSADAGEWPVTDLAQAGLSGDDSDAPVQLDDAAPTAVVAQPQHLRAENITLSQGGAQTIDASSVSITQGGAGRVNADQLSISQGGVGLARTETLTIQSEGSAFAVIADDANIEEGSQVFLVVSRSFSGEVEPTIDWRTALAFGAGFGLVVAILRRLR